MKHRIVSATVALVAVVIATAHRPADTEGIALAWEILVSCSAEETDAAIPVGENHGRLAVHVEHTAEILNDAEATKILEDLVSEYRAMSLAHLSAWVRQKNAQRFLGDQLLKAGYVEEVDTDTPCPQEWLDSRTPLLPQPPS